MSGATEEIGQKALNKQLAHVVAHDVRVKALTVLDERTASPKEVAAVLRERLGTVGHHIRELVKLGLVELVEERPVRGAVEHFYRAITRPLLSTEEWDELDIPERQKFSIWIVQLILADAAKSFSAGTFDRRSTRHLSRIPMVVDEQGWKEVTDIHNQALHAILEVQAKCAERLATTHDEGMNMLAAMLSFEMPEVTDGPKLRKLD